jgi:hypothetical protein
MSAIIRRPRARKGRSGKKTLPRRNPTRGRTIKLVNWAVPWAIQEHFVKAFLYWSVTIMGKTIRNV